jgi:hypothetical protein
MLIDAQESAHEITTRLEMLLVSVRKSDTARVAMLSEMLGQELRRLITPAGGARMGNVRVYPAHRMGFTTAEVRNIWKLVNRAAKLFSNRDPDEACKALEDAIELTRREPSGVQPGDAVQCV